MNLPNSLTMLRILLIPFFLVILLGNIVEDPLAKYIAVGIFSAASLTDFFDGFIARKYNLSTNFGVFADPMADKLLVCSALIAMLDKALIPGWVVIIIISREFIISGFRILAAEQGVVLAASYWGKLKTVSQMLMIIFVLLNFDNDILKMFSFLLVYLSAGLTIVSAFDYIIKNAGVLSDKPKSKENANE